jgi:alcohol dehydrogenase class IV
MWYFSSPQIHFGEDALDYLLELKGKKAFIVTDDTMLQQNFVEQVRQRLSSAGFETMTYPKVEPDPSLENVRNCASEMLTFGPDWVIGLGGGSCQDAAKAAWLLYERPDVDLEDINPIEHYGLRAKARLVTIPTTAGAGAEVTAAAVLTVPEYKRKVELPTPELIADIAIVDPRFTLNLPRSLTADTGIDALTHAVEAYSCTLANDFSDGLCLHAIHLIFEYLPRAVEKGAAVPVAREKMANAATLAGLAITNSHIALCHSLGHSAGALFKLPHGRITGLFLPYTIEFTGSCGLGRYLDIAKCLCLAVDNEMDAVSQVADAIRSLMRQVSLPLSLTEAGISRPDFEAKLDLLIENAQSDLSTATCRRMAGWNDLQQLFEYAFTGKKVDF